MAKLGLVFGVTVTVVALVVAGLVWNEARKEVKYLCLNFRTGDALPQIVRQLDTGGLLHYDLTRTAGHVVIQSSSVYNFNVYTCTVSFDEQDRVQSVVLNGRDTAR